MSEGKKPGWRVHLESVAAQGRAVTRRPGPELSADTTQLRQEHARYRTALEMIADGGAPQIAAEALGRRQSYDDLLRENQELECLVNSMAEMLGHVRAGTLLPSDIPSSE